MWSLLLISGKSEIVPIWQIGKRREALTGNSEVYKKQVTRYLRKRGYYVKASSEVEGIFADCILTKKDEAREYWLEAKATRISLGETKMLAQLGKYLAEYAKRSPANRFRMIIACYSITNPILFEQLFEHLESKTIEKLRIRIAEASKLKAKVIITRASQKDIRMFFEETIVIVANPHELKLAEEKISPSVPVTPTLSDAEYAGEILKKFGDIKPSQAKDLICLNLFELSLPKKLFIGKTPYRTAKSMFHEKPRVIFPSFLLEKGKLYSFQKMRKNSVLGEFVDPEPVAEIDVEEFDKDKNGERIVVRMLNLWIRNECRRMGLWFDTRTQAYYLPKKGGDENPITAVWKPRSRFSKRELTKPMMTDGKINYWVHRAAEIFARKFWGAYYMQIRPRWLFSSDGIYLFEGPRADRLDRAFRKSIYNRNLNQLYDVLFWFRYIFSETDVLGNIRLDNLTQIRNRRMIKVNKQVNLKSHRKPNVEIKEEVEKFDKIESEEVSFFVKTLDNFM